MIKLSSLITELTKRQKELKKDYLFSQSKLHSSNTVPEWAVMWQEIRNSEGFRDELEWKKDDVEKTNEPFNELETTEEIEAEQRSKYFDVIQQYKDLNGEKCWRELTIPKNIDPRKLNQLGVYWAIEKRAAEAHWAKHFKSGGLTVIYEAIINMDVIDWARTMFSRMDMSIGEFEQEIRFLKNSKLFVVSVMAVYEHRTENYSINQYRRL